MIIQKFFPRESAWEERLGRIPCFIEFFEQRLNTFDLYKDTEEFNCRINFATIKFVRVTQSIRI